MKIKWMFLISCCGSMPVAAQSWQLYEEPPLLVKFMQYDASKIQPSYEIGPVTRQATYMGEDQRELELSYLTHNILEGDSVRIYHHSGYNMDGVKQKYAAQQASKINLDDFILSLGYGVEYKVRKDEWVGYEYLSTFPQDQGHSVRVFWRNFFK